MDITSKITGDSFSASECMQMITELENAIEDSGITLASGTLDQLSKAISNYAAGGTFYTDSGAADAYVLGTVGNKLGITNYADGMRITFKVGNTNSGASTVNVNSLGAKDIVAEDGTALIAGDLVQNEFATIVFDNANNRFWLETSTRLRRPFTQKGTVNLGLTPVSVVDPTDGIKITGANGNALSAANPLYITLDDSQNPGQLVTYRITADVTLDPTGAHFGLGTLGDFTDYPLSIYAIDDNGTCKFGIGAVPNHNRVLATEDEATATNCTTVEKIFVNSALSGNSSALEIGWVKANFDDTGGSSEDIWAFNTGIGDVNIGKCPPIWKPSGPISVGATTTPPTKATTPTVDESFWMRVGDSKKFRIAYKHTNNAGAAKGSGDYLFGIVSGLAIDTTKVTAYTTVEGPGDNFPESCVGIGFTGTDVANSNMVMSISVYDTTNLRLMGLYHSGAGCIGSSFGNFIEVNQVFNFNVILPIANWD